MPIVENKLFDKKSQAKQQIIEKMQQTFTLNQEAFQSVMNMVWSNPYGLTAQEIFDAFGTSAKDLFVTAGSFQAAMEAVLPGSAPFSAPLPYRINVDGTVTVL